MKCLELTSWWVRSRLAILPTHAPSLKRSGCSITKAANRPMSVGEMKGIFMSLHTC